MDFLNFLKTINFFQGVIWSLTWIIISLVIGKISFVVAIEQGIYFLIYWILFSILLLFICNNMGLCVNSLKIDDIINSK